MHAGTNLRVASVHRCDEPAAASRWSWMWLTASEARRAIALVSALAALLALAALVTLGVRAAICLNLRWDAFAYHIPYAAARADLAIPYDMNDRMRPAFQGYPPLPALVQGALWRVTGSMNATGVVNYLAFAAFLAHAHRALRAPFWLVAVVALTAPLVVIHSAVSYIDLFGNCFLAIGACSCLSLYLFPERATRGALIGGLAGLAASAWSKYLLVAPAALIFVALALVTSRQPTVAGLRRRTVLCFCAVAVAIAAIPYIKNLIVYDNPFWPFRLPLVGDYFPYQNDALRGARIERLIYQNGIQRGFIDEPGRLELFVKSLFEIGQPTLYPNRPRWIIDQGSTVKGLRMGGFWGIAAIVYMIGVVGMLIACAGRRGWLAAAAAVGMLAFVAMLPQSHELRYYQFIPLAGAGTVGMLFPHLSRVAPRWSMAFLALALGLFVHMVCENWSHYEIRRVDHLTAARDWNAAEWWPKLVRGKTYCAVDMEPIGILLTGPTLSEYKIIDRSRAELCPPNTLIISKSAPARN